MIFAAILHLSAAQPLPDNVWATLSYGEALTGKSETVEFLRGASEAAGSDIVLRHMSRSRNEEDPIVTWTSTRTCPAAAEAVERLKSVPMPTPVFPGDREEIILDGTGYRVRFNARYGSEIGVAMELQSNAGTPLSQWVSQTMRILKPCWSNVRPR